MSVPATKLRSHLNDPPKAIYQLKLEEIKEALRFYKKECIFIRNATLMTNSLQCTFNTFDYPFTKKSPEHLTRTHVLIFITQALYLYGSILKLQDVKWPLNNKLLVEP